MKLNRPLIQLFVVLTLLCPRIAESATPNIVILYADDMGYGDLAIQNPDSKIPTPNLDQLAREGMRFTDAHSSSGICTPSRYALLTGRYHWRKFHGIVNAFGSSVFDPEELTLPEMLKEQGYDTACIGKWHLGWDWSAIRKPGAQLKPISGTNKKAYAPDDFDWSKSIPDGPLDHGFDYYFGDDVPNFPPYAWFENDRVITIPTLPLTETPRTAEGSWEARPGPMVDGWQLDAVMPRLTEQAVRWLHERKARTKPFFLYVPFTSPHAPIVPTQEFIGSSDAGGYGDFMVQTDSTVGQILNALVANGFAENTLVIFTSDNGPEKYAYNRVRKFEHRSMGKLRGLKRDIWEGGHRVPFVVRWPGKIRPHSVNNELIGQVDIMATIASIVGHELSSGQAEDSYDLARTWTEEVPSPRSVHVHNTFKDHYAIRSGEWLLINAKSGDRSGEPNWFLEANGYRENQSPVALFNLGTDIAQKENLSTQQPEKVKELQALLAQLRSNGQVRTLRTGALNN